MEHLNTEMQNQLP